MTEEENLCPICFLPLPSAAEKCPMCGTKLSDAGLGMPDKMTDDKKRREDLTEDERGEAKEVIEELMNIPGMTMEGAYSLYQAGYRSLSEVIQSAFHNDKDYKMASKVLANRLLMGVEEDEEGARKKVRCPSCKSPVDPDDEACGVCGKKLDVGIADLDREYVEMNLETFAGEITDNIMNDPDFAAMPDELRGEIMGVFGKEEAVEDEYQEGIDEIADDKGKSKDKKVKRYKEKLQLWKAKGIDDEIIVELEELLENDFERFKKEAVKILRQRVKEIKERKKG